MSGTDRAKKIEDELRKKFKSPKDAIKKLGLDTSVLKVPRLALDGAKTMKPTRLEYLAVTRTARALNPLLAADAKVEYGPVFAGLTTANLKQRKPTILSDLKQLLKGKTIARDQGMEHVSGMLDRMEHVPEPKSLDESVSQEQHNAMEAAAHGESNLGIPKNVGEEFAEADKGKKFGDNNLGAFLKAKGVDDLPAFLQSKGLSEDDCARIMGSDLGVPGNALDQENAGKLSDAEDPAKEQRLGEPPIKEGGTDEFPDKETNMAGDKKTVTVDEMNKAIEAAVGKANSNALETAQAREFVRPYVGELPIALDSAEKVHRAAAKIIGIDDSDTIHASALPTLIKTVGRPAGATPPANNGMAKDSADSSKGFFERYPGAQRIGAA